METLISLANKLSCSIANEVVSSIANSFYSIKECNSLSIDDSLESKYLKLTMLHNIKYLNLSKTELQKLTFSNFNIKSFDIGTITKL